MKILLEFRDGASGRDMCLAEFDGGAKWICCKHSDGQYVTLREATADDLKELEGK